MCFITQKTCWNTQRFNLIVVLYAWVWSNKTREHKSCRVLTHFIFKELPGLTYPNCLSLDKSDQTDDDSQLTVCVSLCLCDWKSLWNDNNIIQNKQTLFMKVSLRKRTFNMWPKAQLGSARLGCLSSKGSGSILL